MRRVFVPLVLVIILIGANVWQHVVNNKYVQSSLSHEMMSFVPAVDNVVSFYDKDEHHNAAIQMGIAGGELQAMTAQYPGNLLRMRVF